jgi:quercetin dioxygenase-like cupin family protein
VPPPKELLVVAPGQGTPVELRSTQVRVKSSAGSSGGALTAIETNDPAGFAAPAHIHHRATEAFYVLAGTYLFATPGRERKCETGSFVLVPPGVIHGYTATTAGRLLILYLPPGLDEMWQELELAARNGPLTDALRDAIGQRYGIEWV